MPEGAVAAAVFAVDEGSEFLEVFFGEAFEANGAHDASPWFLMKRSLQRLVQKKCFFPFVVSVFEQTSGRLISHFGHIVQ